MMANHVTKGLARRAMLIHLKYPATATYALKVHHNVLSKVLGLRQPAIDFRIRRTKIGGVIMTVRVSMHLTSGYSVGLRIFANGMHCKTVINLQDVSTGGNSAVMAGRVLTD